jgi:hypothetical protein
MGGFETQHGWWVRVAGDFHPGGRGVFLCPPPDFLPAAIPSLNTQFYYTDIKTKNLAIVCVTRSRTILST